MSKITNYLPQLFLVLYVILFSICAINPYDRAVWWAENLPVIIPVLLLVFTFHKFRFSNISYFLMWFFMSIHTIGGHYTFELVPFDIAHGIYAYFKKDELNIRNLIVSLLISIMVYMIFIWGYSNHSKK